MSNGEDVVLKLMETFKEYLEDDLRGGVGLDVKNRSVTKFVVRMDSALYALMLADVISSNDYDDYFKQVQKYAEQKIDEFLRA